MNNAIIPQVLQRIRGEYVEMPGLALKAAQVQRLCGVDAATCREVLTTLVETGFLSMRPDGSYGRFKNPDISRARLANAGPSRVFVTVPPRSRAS
jgi:predicted RNA binding protein YcfA (HicA-like mRNA interferase family)